MQDAVSNHIIETNALTKRFGMHVAVDHVDLKVQASEIFRLMGPNGRQEELP